MTVLRGSRMYMPKLSPTVFCPPTMRSMVLLIISFVIASSASRSTPRSFTISHDQFRLDAKPFQIISASLHYNRVPPEYWHDRLLRLKSMGINAIQTYVPWNFHQAQPSTPPDFSGWRNLTRFLTLAQDSDLLVLLRPGPYICAEWDFGGLPWWLLSPQVEPGRPIAIRTDDPAYLSHVDFYWSHLLDHIKGFTVQAGGPIAMVQIENEYGFYGNQTPTHLRHLALLARRHLGPEVLLYTTDGPWGAALEHGTLLGTDVYTAVDFGPGADVQTAFNRQRQFNGEGLSPPFCSEFYSGWLSHWGEPMANTSTAGLVSSLASVLGYAGGTGSVNLYMGHGGTNFGFWAGANLVPLPGLAGHRGGRRGVLAGGHDGGVRGSGMCGGEGPVGRREGERNRFFPAELYLPHITSYDYDCPIGEAGTSGQLGIGRSSKYHMIRETISKHLNATLPLPPPEPPLAAYPPTRLAGPIPLLCALPTLHPHPPAQSPYPLPMEAYNQGFGLILYSTTLPADSLANGGILNFTLHDYGVIFVNDDVVDRWWRNAPRAVPLPPTSGLPNLRILVEGMGRANFGYFEDLAMLDRKGLVSNVTLDGGVLQGWEVWTLPMTDISGVGEACRGAGDGVAGGVRVGEGSGPLRALHWGLQEGISRGLRTNAPQPPKRQQPSFWKGVLRVEGNEEGGAIADTFLRPAGWKKGVIWVNGHNLGRYWQPLGPQQTLYLPGVWLKEGDNEVLLLELEDPPRRPLLLSLDAPNFSGAESPPSTAVV